MERYFQRKSLNPPSNNSSSSNPPSNNPASSSPPSNNPASSNHPSNNPPTSHPPLNNSSSPKRLEVTELDEILANLPADPGLRPPMTYYNPNFREQIRRAYLQRSPCQPKSQNDMPQTLMGENNRRKAGSVVFIEKGFKNWRKGPGHFRDHVGQVGSLHNKATQHCTYLMNQKQHVETIVIKQTDQACSNYRILLTATLDCTRYLLRQGLPFRGHDESETSRNKGNYVELLQFLANHNEKVHAVVFENAPRNLEYMAPKIQKEFVKSCAAETIDAIISDMDAALFSILVDESCDVSIREQMAVVLGYVNKKGQVIERFVGIQYVSDTTSSKLKEAIEQLISSSNLSMSRLRGQGYDGASNMRGPLLYGPSEKWAYVFLLLAQTIVNVMMLVQKCKQKLQSVRDDDFEDLLREVSIFCGNNDIDVPNMDDLFVPQGRSRRKAQKITNRHYYRMDLFLTIIDKQLVELNNRFTEVNTELLLCMACLSPAYNFATFDKQKILRFAKFYPQEFNDRDLMKLEDQLGLYIVDMQSSTEFSSLNGITDLAEKLVNTGRSRIYNYVYLLLTLALVLPIATASVERAFSAMNIVKTPLRNKMGNQWLSDSLVVYIEKEFFSCISNANIMRRFHDMKPRRQQL
ncbi:PREDICTED: zinc finger MYM-type protein 1-like [Prunus mume]|uniref:Zinc finger MYM-type protein 1-like n=1 Tax=Prunus mume TaxID=102107 RepID=A0ABM0P1H1_PRUMU|nr:PREDICTED: zinc finger MYM-type protein 1-like [Prunus mume]